MWSVWHNPTRTTGMATPVQRNFCNPTYQQTNILSIPTTYSHHTLVYTKNLLGIQQPLLSDTLFKPSIEVTDYGGLTVIAACMYIYMLTRVSFRKYVKGGGGGQNLAMKNTV